MSFSLQEVRKHVGYNTLLGKALIAAGRAQEYLNNVEESFNNDKSDAESNQFLRDFPRGGILELWSKHPELEPKSESQLGWKYA